MTDNKKQLLEIRRAIRKRQPAFSRKDSNKKKRIEAGVWRLARGCDNKHRLNRKGHRNVPSSGYRAPALVRGLDASGLIPVNVSTPSALAKLTKDHGVVVSGRAGDRKRKLIIQEAQKLGLKVLNLDAVKTVEQIDAKLNARKSEKQKEEAAAKAAEAKKHEKPAKKEEHKAHDHKEQPHAHAHTSDEDKKKAEKAEKDKVLHTKQ